MKRMKYPGLLLFVSLLPSVVLCNGASSVPIGEFLVDGRYGASAHCKSDGHYLVYTTQRYDGFRSVWLYDSVTRETKRVIDQPWDCLSPSISDGLMVWEDWRQLGHPIAYGCYVGNQPFKIEDEEGFYFELDVSSRFVGWRWVPPGADRSGIQIWDRSTHKVTTLRDDYTVYCTAPSLWEDKVAWSEMDPYDQHQWSEIVVWDPIQGYHNFAGSEGRKINVTIHDNLVTWQHKVDGQWLVNVYDLETGILWVVGPGCYPTTYSRWMAWVDSLVLHVYDVDTGATFEHQVHGATRDLALSDYFLFWSERRDWDHDIYGVTLSWSLTRYDRWSRSSKP